MTTDYPTGIRIYNLFPRLLGPMSKWIEHLARIKDMEFDWVFVNPFHYPGFSGSLYAVKDYYRFNPLFLSGPDSDGWQEFGQFIQAAHHLGLKVMMDLVINHTAIDCELTKTRPEWYLHEADGRIKSPSCIDPADARKVTVWGDLAEIDNYNSPDRKALWDYWNRLVQTYMEAGIDGFRCDAAYQVPGKLWEYLIDAARNRGPVLFFAETLGATEKKIAEIARSGFEYVSNSSKWWDFTADWCLKQHDLTRKYTASVSFPETHDTPRLALESGGNPEICKQRYLFAALFSTGLMMPIGYEYGFRQQLNVVHTMPAEWEDPRYDLTDFIRQVNKLKADYRIFNEDNPISLAESQNPEVAVLKKSSLNGQQSAWLVINKNPHHSRHIRLEFSPSVVSRLIGELQPGKSPSPIHLEFQTASVKLSPGQIRIFVAD